MIRKLVLSFMGACLVSGTNAFAGLIFQTDNPEIGPPSAQLFGGPVCFFVQGGSSQCDYTQISTFVGGNPTVTPLAAPKGPSGELISLDGEVSPFASGHIHPTYFLGNNLVGTFTASLTLAPSVAEFVSASFTIATDHVFPGPTGGSPGRTTFTAYSGLNYYAVIFGYATEPVEFTFTISPSALPEPPSIVLFVAAILALVALRVKHRT